jgi:hypothetical protein
MVSPPAIVKLTQAGSAKSGTIYAVYLYDQNRFFTGGEQEFSWSVLNQVGVELKGYSLTYTGPNGESLPTLTVSFAPVFVRTEGGSKGAVQILVAPPLLMDLFSKNAFVTAYDNIVAPEDYRSTLSPTICSVHLYFEDDNKHKFTLDTQSIIRTQSV